MKQPSALVSLVIVTLLGVTLALCPADASAQLAISGGILDRVVGEFSVRAAFWRNTIMNAAAWLFWTLGTISLAWTGVTLILRKADVGEFFAEFVRFIMFFGFFLWLLRNGPDFALSIIDSLRRLGSMASSASGVSPPLSPSGIVDIGFKLYVQGVTSISVVDPLDSLIAMFLTGIILVVLAIIAVNMLLLNISAWILMYAGIFFLGFGGSRWTSEMAINYFRTVFGTAVQYMTMLLLIGIGCDMLTELHSNMDQGALDFSELGVMLVFCVALLLLTNKIPGMVAGIVTGAPANGGTISAGAAMGMAMSAAKMAAMGAATAGAMAAAGAANAAGGLQTIQASLAKAAESASAASSDTGFDSDFDFGGGGSDGKDGSSGGDGSGGASCENDRFRHFARVLEFTPCRVASSFKPA